MAHSQAAAQVDSLTGDSADPAHCKPVIRAAALAPPM